MGKVSYRQSGYIGSRMSERAKIAYDNGEKPLSKWNKENIIEEFYDYVTEINSDYADEVDKLMPSLRRLVKNELIDLLLERSSWHHTGKFAKETDFYYYSEDKIFEDDKLLITEELINDIINKREPKPRTKKEKIENLYITSIVEYDEWEGRYANHQRKVHHKEVAFYRTKDKMINVGYTRKRLSSVVVVFSIEQKTKFATKETILKKYESKNKKG